MSGLVSACHALFAPVAPASGYQPARRCCGGHGAIAAVGPNAPPSATSGAAIQPPFVASGQSSEQVQSAFAPDVGLFATQGYPISAGETPIQTACGAAPTPYGEGRTPYGGGRGSGAARPSGGYARDGSFQAVGARFAAALGAKTVSSGNGVWVVHRSVPTPAVTLHGASLQSPMLGVATFSFQNYSLYAPRAGIVLGQVPVAQANIAATRAMLRRAGVRESSYVANAYGTRPAVGLLQIVGVGVPDEVAARIAPVLNPLR